jgi:hypothetical protein
MNTDIDEGGYIVVETKSNEVERLSVGLTGSRNLALDYLTVLIWYFIILVELPCGSTQAVKPYEIEEESRGAKHRPRHR